MTSCSDNISTHDAPAPEGKHAEDEHDARAKEPDPADENARGAAEERS